MLGKTHLFAGMAAAVTLSGADTPATVVAALAVGAVSGVFADVDALKDDKAHDALIAQLCALGAVIVAVALDSYFDWGIQSYELNRFNLFAAGCAGLVAMWLFGFFQKHRGFTHSIAALGLFALASYLICPPAMPCALYGYLSHILLDLLNKKGLRLLWPSRQTHCLSLCYADRAANKLIMWLSLIWAGVVTAVRLV